MAVVLRASCIVSWKRQSRAFATSSTGPTVQVQATYHGFVILTVTGMDFSPMSPVTISVDSSLEFRGQWFLLRHGCHWQDQLCAR